MPLFSVYRKLSPAADVEVDRFHRIKDYEASSYQAAADAAINDDAYYMTKDYAAQLFVVGASRNDTGELFNVVRKLATRTAELAR